jgi:predicted Zn-dependent protease
VDAFALLAEIYAHRGQSVDLEAILATAEKRVPDDLSPYYRAAEALLAAGQDLARAERYLRRYSTAEPEGNAPPLSEVNRKLGQVREKAKAISATGATPGPG